MISKKEWDLLRKVSKHLIPPDIYELMEIAVKEKKLTEEECRQYCIIKVIHNLSGVLLVNMTGWIKMKCVFSDKDCEYQSGKYQEHDRCIDCKKKPDFSVNNGEANALCGIAGYRGKQKEYYGVPFYARSPPAWFSKITNNLADIPCCDHLRFLKNVAILEPYKATRDEILKLMMFCSDHDLNFIIDGSSAHFPGRTFRILLFKKDCNIPKPII